MSIIGALALVIVAIGVWLVVDSVRSPSVTTREEFRALSSGLRDRGASKGGGWAAGAGGAAWLAGNGNGAPGRCGGGTGGDGPGGCGGGGGCSGG